MKDDRTETRRPRALILGAAIGVLLLFGAAACGSDGGDLVAQDTTTTGDEATSVPEVPEDGLSLVAIGDSIPDQIEEDCPGCTGFVERYAAAVEEATGTPVSVDNRSDHSSKTLEQLLQDLESPDLQEAIAQADVVVVGIAHNSNELNLDEPCGAPLVDDRPEWAAMTEACATTSADVARSQYDELYSQIVQLRAGEPTIFRTINRYNDWIGWDGGNLTPEQESQTATFVTTWSSMICDSAEANGFGCADVSTAFNGPDGLSASGDRLAADYTHPSDAGHELIATLLEDLGFNPLA